MSTLNLPVRYYRDYVGAYDYGYETLSLPLSQTAFLVVDINGDLFLNRTLKYIAPALAAARTAKMQVSYVHNDLRLVADPGNIVFEIWGKTKGDHLDMVGPLKNNPGFKTEYHEAVRPLADEPDFPKWVWSGFRDTFLDQHLRALDIKTLVCVGYSLRACLYGTLIDAVYRNYRVVVLRDAVQAHEMPDTCDKDNPEDGWINRIMLRQVEHLIGYTSTTAEFVAACQAAKK